jgi:uncharacterized membrane protein YphA (DoxX/SURF4 family)
MRRLAWIIEPFIKPCIKHWRCFHDFFLIQAAYFIQNYSILAYIKIVKKNKMTNKREKIYDYFILCARVLIAFMFLTYGWSKLVDQQFGLSDENLAKPVKELSLFQLSWYLFDHQPFKAFIGVSQIIAAFLLLYHRTLLLGALLSIPILINILVIDITYLKMPGFYWRLSYYLCLDFLILWHYKDRIITVIKQCYGTTTRFKYPIWAYLLLPIMIVLLEMAGTIPRVLIALCYHPSETIQQLKAIVQLLFRLF